MLDTGVYNDEKISVRLISATGVSEVIEGASPAELSGHFQQYWEEKQKVSTHWRLAGHFLKNTI